MGSTKRNKLRSRCGIVGRQAVWALGIRWWAARLWARSLCGGLMVVSSPFDVPSSLSCFRPLPPPCLRPSVAPLPFYRLRSRAQDRPEKAWVGDRERGRLAGWLGLAGLVGSHLLCVAALSHNNSRSTTTHYTKGEGVHGIARCDRASWGHWEYGWRAFGTVTTSVVYLQPGTRKEEAEPKKKMGPGFPKVRSAGRGTAHAADATGRPGKSLLAMQCRHSPAPSILSATTLLDRRRPCHRTSALLFDGAVNLGLCLFSSFPFFLFFFFSFPFF